MHRHGYKGRKFGRERDPRKALINGLAEALTRDGSITTTRAKAKDLVPYFEKLITKAKKGTLASRRLILKDLTVTASHKLVDEIVPKLDGRTSGHLRIKPAGWRRGDNAAMAKVSFVDDITAKAKPTAKAVGKKVSSKKTEEMVDKSEQPVIQSNADSGADMPAAQTVKLAPKRTGIRGNR